MRVNRKIIERPQHLLMRVSLGIHGSNINKSTSDRVGLVMSFKNKKSVS